jgi:hypothetical protein
MAEVQRPSRMSSCEKSYRVDKVCRERVIAAQGKSVLHREALERSCIRRRKSRMEPDDGVFMRL